MLRTAKDLHDLELFSRDGAAGHDVLLAPPGNRRVVRAAQPPAA